MDVVDHVDDLAPAATAYGQPGDADHPWHRWDDGRLWREIYHVRTAMLVAFAAAAWLSGSTAVACTVFFLVVPFNVLVGVHHRQTGEAGWRLVADQYLAGCCAVIDPKVALGVVVCQLVGAVTGVAGRTSVVSARR